MTWMERNISSPCKQCTACFYVPLQSRNAYSLLASLTSFLPMDVTTACFSEICFELPAKLSLELELVLSRAPCSVVSVDLIYIALVTFLSCISNACQPLFRVGNVALHEHLCPMRSCKHLRNRSICKQCGFSKHSYVYCRRVPRAHIAPTTRTKVIRRQVLPTQPMVDWMTMTC